MTEGQHGINPDHLKTIADGCRRHSEALADVAKEITKAIGLTLSVPDLSPVFSGESPLGQILGGQDQVGDEMRRLGESMRQGLDIAVPRLVEPNASLFGLPSNLFTGLDAHSPIRQKDLKTLADHGWYLDPEMPVDFARAAAKAFEEEDENAVSEWLVGHYRERVDEMENSVVSSFPDRKEILADAFDAHRRGIYNLSVPVLLTQADGMCYDTWAFCLFMASQRNANVVAFIGKSGSAFEKDLIRLLGEPIPLWLPEKDRGSAFAELNRHQVMHGESVTYGTEENSLKAISFLSYLCLVLRR